MTKELYAVKVYNTITGEVETVSVSKEVYETTMRTHWNIKKQNKSFYDHEIQMSSLHCGEDGDCDTFDEFVDYEANPENEVIDDMVRRTLYNILNLLSPKEYELIYSLYFCNLTEEAYAARKGISHQAIHKQKNRILKKIKNFFENEGC